MLLNSFANISLGLLGSRSCGAFPRARSISQACPISTRNPSFLSTTEKRSSSGTVQAVDVTITDKARKGRRQERNSLAHCVAMPYSVGVPMAVLRLRSSAMFSLRHRHPEPTSAPRKHIACMKQELTLIGFPAISSATSLPSSSLSITGNREAFGRDACLISVACLQAAENLKCPATYISRPMAGAPLTRRFGDKSFENRPHHAQDKIRSLISSRPHIVCVEVSVGLTAPLLENNYSCDMNGKNYRTRSRDDSTYL